MGRTNPSRAHRWRAICAVTLATVVVAQATARAQATPGEAVAPPPVAARSEGCPPPPPFSPHLYLLEREVVRQTLRVDDLRNARRRWQPAAVTFGLGIATLAVGAVLLKRSLRYDEDGYESLKPVMESAGIIMLPLGSLMMLVAGPLFGVRASRTLRLGRAERALALATTPTPVP